MTFDLLQVGDKPYGYKAEYKNGLFFFGFQNCTTDILSDLFPKLNFYKAQQVHGAVLAKAPFLNTPTADAVWTEEPLVAPSVITADCLPILVLHPDFSAAIHAGWRGVLSEIVPKTLSTLFSSHPNNSDLKICIGPHIQAQSFEVGTEVVKSFEGSLPYFDARLHSRPHTDPDKSYLDLNAIVSYQIATFGITDKQISRLPYDTLGDVRWASYRRDKQRNLRNLSFAARLK
jgi:YfiH family protein